MRIGIELSIRKDWLDSLCRLSLLPQGELELLSVGDVQVLALVQAFPTFKDALSAVERLKTAIEGYVCGTLQLYIQEGFGEEFIPLTEWACKLEQRLSDLGGQRSSDAPPGW